MAWGVGVTVVGYLLGKSIPSVDCYLLPIIAVVVVLRKGRPDAADRVSMSV
jgi:membrane-associated protein